MPGFCVFLDAGKSNGQDRVDDTLTSETIK
jgi:hypothetical protein